MKNSKLFSKLIGAILGLMVFTSCEKEYFVPEPAPDTVSYETDIQSYFDDSCVGCHDGLQGYPLNLEASVSYKNLVDGGFIDLSNPSKSSLYTKIIAGGSMNQYTKPSDISNTLKWIEEGAENN